MSWEAQRLTSKTPSEVYTVLGPHGCDDLVRQAIATAWRETPEEGRTFKAAKQRLFESFTRNLNIWRAIKKPVPEAFFDDFRPHDNVEAFLRQAMVLSWMMMPRTGGRDFKSTFAIIRRLYERNVAAWEEDEATFNGKRTTKGSKGTKKAGKVVKKKGAQRLVAGGGKKAVKKRK